jgi:hypothetical protein
MTAATTAAHAFVESGDEEASPPQTGRGIASLAALCTIARFHQIAADPATLAHQLGLAPSDALTATDLLRAAKHLGLKAKRSSTQPDRLNLAALPALALMSPPRSPTTLGSLPPEGAFAPWGGPAALKRSPGEGAADRQEVHAVILAQCDGQRVLLQDPGATEGAGRPTIEPLEVFAQQWTGELILITSRASLAGDLAKFDFSWFIPSLVKYRKLLGEVLLISFFLQLFALISPLFFQVVMDKVLVHRGMTTLDVLVIGLVVVVVFESLLNGMRSYVFKWPDYFQTWATPKIWLGPAGTVTPLHCDYDDNLFAQIWGQKRFLLYPPHHAESLYLREANRVLFGSPFDPEAPDYDAFPLARQARQIECVVQPGEMLFLPAGWFHHVRAVALSLSANRWAYDRPLALNDEKSNK